MYLLLLAVLILHCCLGFSLVSESRGFSLKGLRSVHGLLVGEASLVVEHGLAGVSSCGLWAQQFMAARL